MSDASKDPFGLAGPEAPERFQKAVEVALGAVPYVGLLIGIFGTALLLMMLAPDRQRRGIDRLRRAPVMSFLIGVLLWSLPAIALTVLLVKFGDKPRGQILLSLWVFFSGCAGYAVCARALGERLLPDRGAVAQTALGLCALVLPLFTLIGLPVLLIGAPLGLGAWVSARREPPRDVTDTPVT
ncbi:MAG: hypothetical protein H0W78_05730 [Planctomycetes bacterium]|nr:hypothetical protein [Planctomycetota bacterium]